MTLINAEPRWIDLEGAANARDVGGIPLVEGGEVASGRLLRSDNLQDLSPADVAHLVEDHGLRAVIDLRTGVEVRLEGPGPLLADPRVVVEHRSLYPEAGEHTDVVDADAIVPWQMGQSGADLPDESPTVQTYMGYLEHRPDSIVGALRTIAQPPEGGATLVHCAAGKDRTGLVVALALEAAGAHRRAIVADYAVTAQRIEAIVARLASSPTYAQDVVGHDPGRHAPRPASMARVLELLDERHGSPAGWLADHGLEDDALEALRVRLTAGA
ncbi:MAG: tyrosine-protein phosphatase [Conexibacter sp.]|nr:tyrosine-protein phosphatase [Conexibacter sp.]